jgi:hypothetical protein
MPVATPTIPAGALLYEDNSSSVTFSAGWTQVFDARASAGHYRRSSQVGATATFSFDVEDGSVRWGAIRGPSGGRADVAVDGVFQRTVDLYAPTAGYWYETVFTPLPGHHSLRITVRGDADVAATGADVAVDFFEVLESVAGRGFTLQSQPVTMSWGTGTAQTGFVLARISDSETSVLPPGGAQLPSWATSYTDSTAALGAWFCYSLFAMRGSDAIGSSDVLCLIPNVHSGDAPSDFRVRLDQSNVATLSWGPPSPFVTDITGYVVLTLLSGQRVIPVALNAGTGFNIQDDTGGQPTCYVLVAMSGATPLGNSDALCAAPGFSSLGSAALARSR